MKIGMVSSQFGNFLRGGAEIQFENTVQALKELGIDCEIINSNSTDINQYDLIHFFKSDEYFVSLSEYLKNINKPYVVSTVFYPEKKSVKFLYKILGFVYKFLKIKQLCPVKRIEFWNNANMLFPNTETEKEFINSVVTTKANTVHNCIEDYYFHNHICENKFYTYFENLKGKKFVLCVGRIEPRKNQYKLIEACKNNQLDLVLIGKVRDESYWEKCLSIGYEKVYCLGEIYDKDLLISAYKACEVYAQPSTMETPGLSALEAASQGTKIVITKYGGTKEYFGETAFYVDPNSIKDITFKIKIAFEKDIEDNSNYYKKFRYSIIAKQYIKYYQEIIDE